MGFAGGQRCAARRVLLEGNVLENCWTEGQTGFANVFERFGETSDFADTGRGGIMFQVSGADLTFRHNTARNDVNMISQTRPGTDNLVFIDNLVTPGSYGVHCDGNGPWNAGIGTHIRGASRFEGNTIIRVGTERAQRTSPNGYPPKNLWFDSFEQAGVDPANYRLLPDSPVRGTASDGTDPGADIDAVMAATAGVHETSP